MFLKKKKKFNEAIPDFDFDNYNEDYIERAAYTIFMNKNNQFHTHHQK